MTQFCTFRACELKVVTQLLCTLPGEELKTITQLCALRGDGLKISTQLCTLPADELNTTIKLCTLRGGELKTITQLYTLRDGELKTTTQLCTLRGGELKTMTQLMRTQGCELNNKTWLTLELSDAWPFLTSLHLNCNLARLFVHSHCFCSCFHSALAAVFSRTCNSSRHAKKKSCSHFR